MAQAAVARPLPAPWTFRLFDALPLSPIWVGFGLAGVVLAIWLAAMYATGSLALVLSADEHMLMHLRLSVVQALSLGYLPVAQVYLARWTRRHLEELRPLLRRDASLEADPLASQGRRVAGISGASALVLLFLVLPWTFTFLKREYWTFYHAWDWIVLPVMGWMAGRLFYAMVADARRFSRLADCIETLDLFDLERYAPFIRQGLRSALLVVIFLAITTGLVGVVVVSETAGLTSWAIAVGIATTALLLPVRGIHARIRREKRDRLSELRGRIRADEASSLAAGPDSAAAASRLPGLLALEARIASVREWPFDASSLLRFGFYLALGLGSWLGSAAVERLLDVALD